MFKLFYLKLNPHYKGAQKKTQYQYKYQQCRKKVKHQNRGQIDFLPNRTRVMAEYVNQTMWVERKLRGSLFVL